MDTPESSQNESVFLEVDAPSTLVIQHVSPPRYILTITLIPDEGGTPINKSIEASPA